MIFNMAGYGDGKFNFELLWENENYGSSDSFAAGTVISGLSAWEVLLIDFGHSGRGDHFWRFIEVDTTSTVSSFQGSSWGDGQHLIVHERGFAFNRQYAVSVEDCFGKQIYDTDTWTDNKELKPLKIYGIIKSS